jgi:hypothetical protein
LSFAASAERENAVATGSVQRLLGNGRRSVSFEIWLSVRSRTGSCRRSS